MEVLPAATGAVDRAPSSSDGGGGAAFYYRTKLERLQNQIAEKKRDLWRLQSQRNELNSRVRGLRDEIQLLQEPGSHVGEVVRAMGKKKVLVKVGPEGKYLVDLDPEVDVNLCTPNTRVALKSDSYMLHKILPSKVDPLVSLMRVEKVPDSTYDMVGGLDEQIRELKEVIELPIRHPELFEALGIAQPKGVIMYGPPGTGKTLLARAVAHHTDCQFIRVSGAELVQKYIGEGARMVRELFVMARERAPTIIFMDEVDSIGSARTDGGGDSEVQRTMLELLNQLDGFEPSTQIKIIMATNRLDILDPALLRPGRIDRKIEFPAPSAASREMILKIHSKKMNLMRGIDLKSIALKLGTASGAECKAVCTEAGMFALRERRVHVTLEDFEMAATKVMKKSEDANTSISKLFKAQVLQETINRLARRIEERGADIASINKQILPLVGVEGKEGLVAELETEQAALERQQSVLKQLLDIALGELAKLEGAVSQPAESDWLRTTLEDLVRKLDNLHDKLDRLIDKVDNITRPIPKVVQDNLNRMLFAVLHKCGAERGGTHDATGVAFFVRPTLAITAYHVLSESYSDTIALGATVYLSRERGLCEDDESVLETMLVRFDEQEDWALMKLSKPTGGEGIVPFAIANASEARESYCQLVHFDLQLAFMEAASPPPQISVSRADFRNASPQFLKYTCDAASSGDAGGGVAFVSSKTGRAVAMHCGLVSALKRILEGETASKKAKSELRRSGLVFQGIRLDYLQEKGYFDNL